MREARRVARPAQSSFDRRGWLRRDMAKRKERALSYLGTACAKCGSTQRLEIDHIDQATKTYDIGSFLNKPWEELMLELDKCQLLCHLCHKEKTRRELQQREPWNKGLGEHGSYVAYYSRKCRCVTCNVWHVAHLQKRRNKVS